MLHSKLRDQKLRRHALNASTHFAYRRRARGCYWLWRLFREGMKR